ncbi:uncharacterized protein [Polyergus mexicanus]|uniref:uncharacterized protein n=1 Tax=Polyergus mexicanus TaxID=615972 RepID=UPI0038B57EC2
MYQKYYMPNNIYEDNEDYNNDLDYDASNDSEDSDDESNISIVSQSFNENEKSNTTNSSLDTSKYTYERKLLQTSAMTRRAISNESFIFSEKQSSHLLPVLSTLQRKLENLNKSDLIDCHSLVEAIQQGLNKRFLTIFETKELIIAACLHPKFKLNWLTGEKRKRAENYLEDLLGIRSTENSSKAGKSDDHDDFFIFEQKTVQNESEQEELQRSTKQCICRKNV